MDRLEKLRSFGLTLAMGVAALLPLPSFAAGPVTDESKSSFAYDDASPPASVAITNVSYAITGSYLAGRPKQERLLLRTTVSTREVIDEVGMDANLTVEAWPLGADLGTAPAYKLEVGGATGMTTLDNGVIVVARGTEDVRWSSVYALGTGAHLFDSFVPVSGFSITPEVQTVRYAGLEVPPDDAEDARLADPKVVGVLSYAAAAGVIGEALITCDDADRAQLLRSYWDASRDIAAEGEAPAVTLKLTWQVYGEDAVSATVPVADDKLNLAGAQLPACMQIAAWQR